MTLKQLYFFLTGKNQAFINKDKEPKPTQNLGELFESVILFRIAEIRLMKMYYIKNVYKFTILDHYIISLTESGNGDFKLLYFLNSVKDYFKINKLEKNDSIDSFLNDHYQDSEIFSEYNTVMDGEFNVEENFTLENMFVNLISNKDIFMAIRTYCDELEKTEASASWEIMRELYRIKSDLDLCIESICDDLCFNDEDSITTLKNLYDTYNHINLESSVANNRNYFRKFNKYLIQTIEPEVEDSFKLVLESLDNEKDFFNPDAQKNVAEKREEELSKFEKEIVLLKTNIVGQDKALNRITDILYSRILGYRMDNKPFASFIFTGPTGVGKTETAEQIAKIFCDGIIKTIDMSTYKGDHNIASLIGSPPGYVGYSDKVPFLEFIKEDPKCVILFDEIDKADPKALDILIHMLDKGEIISAKSERYIMSNSIIICTTNITTNGHSIVGFGKEKEEDIRIEISEKSQDFRKELLGRFDDVIKFNSLEKNEIKILCEKYINLAIQKYENANSNFNFKIEYNKNIIEEIIDDTSNVFGARGLKAQIEKVFCNSIASHVRMSGGLKKNLKLYFNNLNDITESIAKPQQIAEAKSTYEIKKENEISNKLREIKVLSD